MKIVTRNSDGAVMMIADCPTAQYDPAQYTAYDIIKWDWSLVDLTGIDTTKATWIYCNLQWDGSTLVKRSTPLADPYIL